MKKLLVFFITLFIAVDYVFALTAEDINKKIRGGYWYPIDRYETGIITKKETAIAIGVAVAREIYGDERVDRFLPYDATEEEYEGNKVWLVKGKPDVYAVGGYQVDGPIIRVRKNDGTILTAMFMH